MAQRLEWSTSNKTICVQARFATNATSNAANYNSVNIGVNWQTSLEIPLPSREMKRNKFFLD